MYLNYFGGEKLKTVSGKLQNIAEPYRCGAAIVKNQFLILS